MRKIFVTVLATVAMMGIASLAFAADGAAAVKLDYRRAAARARRRDTHPFAFGQG